MGGNKGKLPLTPGKAKKRQAITNECDFNTLFPPAECDLYTESVIPTPRV
jgi:hypothetical protein